MANRIKDRTGKVYGQLKALHMSRRSGVIYWTMECVDCREKRDVRSPGMRDELTCKRCGFRKDLVGSRSGSLKVTAFSHSKNWKAYWHVKCDCGARKVLSTTVLTGSRAQKWCGQSCPRKLLDDEVRVKRRKIIQYKSGAATRNIEWALTGDEAWALMQSDCYWCGERPQLTTFWVHDRRTRTAKWRVNGIDRLDSNKGYVQGNCVPCCSKCNVTKSDLPVADFLAHVAAVLRHQGSLQ